MAFVHTFHIKIRVMFMFWLSFFFCLWLTLFPQRPISNPYYQTKLWIFFLLFSNQLIFFESCTKPNRVDTFDWTIFAHLLIIHLKSIWLVQKLFTFRINYYKEREKMMQKWSNICQKIYFWNGFLFEYVYIYIWVCVLSCKSITSNNFLLISQSGRQACRRSTLSMCERSNE